MTYVFWILRHAGGLILILTAAAGAGMLAARRIRFDNRVEQIAFVTVVGLGMWASLILLLGIAGLLYAPLLAFLTLAAAGITLVIYLSSATRACFDAIAAVRRAAPLRKLATFVVLAAGVAYWLLLLAGAQYPPMLWDSISYHLVLCRTYLEHHRIESVVGVVFPVLPSLNHMLFVWAMALCDDVLAQMVTHALMMLTAVGLIAWGRRLRSPWLGIAAAAVWLGHPLVLAVGEAAYVDVGLATFVFFGLYALKVAWDGDVKWWPLGLALLGVAAGIKSPGLPLLAAAVALGVVHALRGNVPGRFIAGGVLCAALASGPSYGVVTWYAGNPLWPTIAWHTQGAWRLAAESFWNVWGGIGVSKTLPHFLEVTWLVVRTPDVFYPDGGRHLLPIVAAFPLVLVLALFVRSLRWWCGWAVIYLALWFESSQQVRFLVAILPVMGLAICEAIRVVVGRLPGARVWRPLAWTAVVVSSLVTGGRITLAEVHAKRWPPPVTLAERHRFLAGLMGGYSAAEYVNSVAQPGERVFILHAAWLTYYLTSETRDPLTLLEPHVMPTFTWPADRDLLDRLGTEHVSWVVVVTDDEIPAVRERLRTEGAEIWPGFIVAGVFGTTAVLHRTD